MRQISSMPMCIFVWDIIVRNTVTAPNWKQSSCYFPSKQCGCTGVTRNEIAGSYYAMHICFVLLVGDRIGHLG